MSTDGSKPSFIFATCQVGAEPLLKAELARTHPELRVAFARPGFLTFKGEGLSPSFVLRSVFARAFGLSLGKLTGATDEARLAGVTGECVHVWERDHVAPGDETRALGPTPLARSLQEQLGRRATPAPGERVTDVVIVEPSEWWLGAHVHGPAHAPYAGGVPELAMPAAAPSRAYLKIEEAIRRFDLPMARGDRVVEIGSAPGGATYALLERGLTVIGIDPAAMHPSLSARRATFRHIQRQVGDVLREDLPERIEWLLLDMNAEPDVALANAERLLERMGDGLKGLVFTVKLNSPALAANIPDYLVRVQSAGGLAQVHAKQLASNRREITLVGLRSVRGAARTNGE